MSTSTVIPVASDSFDKEPTMERYRRAYRAAEGAMSFAESIKYGSIFVAGVIVIIAVLLYQSSRAERSGFPVVSVSLAAGAIAVVLIARLWSEVVRMKVRRLEIAVGSAVNSSPFLSSAEPAKITPFPNDLAIRGKRRKRVA
jgi:hypothetical protein